MRMRSASALPNEIIFLILEEIILDGDLRTLKAVSTVSRGFCEPCRGRLFRHIRIAISSDRRYSPSNGHSPDSFLDFAKFLGSNAHVLKSIRKLVLLDVSGPPKWTLEAPDTFEDDPPHRWSTVASPLARVLNGIESLQYFEIRSDTELDWPTFDVGIKRAVYDLLRRPSCAATAVRFVGLRGVTDGDLLSLVEPCADVALTQVHFDLSSGRSAGAISGSCLSDPVASTCEPAAASALVRLRLGREMGIDALNWLAVHPQAFASVRYLAMESFSSAPCLEDLWKFAQGTRHSLEYLEWWFEDLGFREPADLLALQQIDLSIFPELRSFAVCSSQSGQLINCMVILESTKPANTIEEITIIMPSSIDKFMTFRPSAVWKRFDAVFASARFKTHLRAVTLSFAWRIQPLQESTLHALFAAFKQNLPSLRGKALTVTQRKACAF